MTEKPRLKFVGNRTKQKGKEHREKLFAELLAGESEDTKAKIRHINKLLDIREDDAMWLCMLVISRCHLSVSPLSELAKELQDNLKDFKSAVYDVRRESDRLAHLLQRKLGGIQQLPLSRAMWACGAAACIGMVSGITVMGGLFLFALHNDCNFKTLECPKLHLKSQS